MRFAFVLAALTANLFAAPSFAKIVQFEYVGEVSLSMGAGFAAEIPPSFTFPGDPPPPTIYVKGQFTYDTATPAVLANGYATYRQNRLGGWSLSLGEKVGDVFSAITTFTADNYDVIISNDLPQPGDPPAPINDVIEVRIASDAVPAFSSPIRMDWINQPSGVLDVSFFASSLAFSDLSLPGVPKLTDFEYGYGVLSHVPQGNVDAFLVLRVTAITPEPSSKWLSLMAASMLGLYCGRTSLFSRFSSVRRSKMTG